MRFTGRLRRSVVAALALVLVAGVVAACGSSGGAGSQNSGGGGAPSARLAIKQNGPGLTQPTSGSGARIKGGTATFAEAPAAPPNYISPMLSPQYCTASNGQELTVLLYRPLYWFGNNYSPTVDYNDSIGRKPVFSDDDRVVTIHLNDYKWSDGEQVSARDIVFWLNVLKVDPAKEWCGYVPGKYPDNIVSYKAVNPTTFQMTLNRSYNPTWVLYNELSEITPLPMAWDRTSLSQKAPNPSATHLPDTTKAGAAAVWNLLNTQSQKIATWGSSPLWKVVDGPWRVQSTTSNGGVTLVANQSYSGNPKPSLSKFIEVPFTSESAMVNEIKAQGPHALTVAYIPAQFQPLTSSFENQGYDVNMALSYETVFAPINQHAPKVGAIFRQLYARQALEHLVDQSGWIKHFLHGDGIPTYGPVPLAPANPLASSDSETNPDPFSVAAAAKLLKENGWKLDPGSTSTCIKPGTGPGECGKGVAKGQPFEFTLNYESDVASVQEEMQDLQSQASKVGITINLTSHPFADVAGASAHCAEGTALCDWDANNYGAGWGWGTGHYPTGEFLYSSQSSFSNYESAKMNKLVNATVYASPNQERAAMQAYVKYTSQQIPYLWLPEQVGAFQIADAGTLIDNKLGGFTANAFGAITPEDWYLTK